MYRAVAATAGVAPSNTNLGMALLFAPLAAAARAQGRTGLRHRLARVLRGLSVDDARWAYRAIRLARPGGLGRSDEAPVARPPAITLLEAMRLAARRDTVAAEYVRGFAVTFDLGLARLRRALGRGLSLLDAIAQAHLELMARVPDTLIARKAGAAAAAAVAARAGAVVRAGGVVTPRGLAAARRLDRDLRRHGNRLNPGTSADLIAAALFVWLLETPARRRLAGATRRGSRAATDGTRATTGSRGRPAGGTASRAQPARPTPPAGPNVRDGAARQAMSEFRVRIEKDYTVFCAGHFITYDGHECEPLHGHNYRAAAALEGPLDENAYVFDFTRLKRALRAIVDRLDHRMLLPTRSALIHVTQSGAEVQAAYRDKRYVFPASDVVLLPISNTTAEMLAWWIAQELKQGLGTLPRRGHRRSRSRWTSRPASAPSTGRRSGRAPTRGRGARDVAVDRLPRARLERGRPPEPTWPRRSRASARTSGSSGSRRSTRPIRCT